MDAIVVGGGIAGLSAAISLMRAEWTVTVLERAPQFGEIGAGLSLTGNGLAALDAIGLADATRAVGTPITVVGTRNDRGRWLMRMPADPSTSALGVHRARLHSVLLDAAAAATDLVAGAGVLDVEPGTPGAARARVRWHDGTDVQEREADLVVAADGLRSVVRAQLFPHSGATYTGKTCWRAVVDDAAVADDRFAVFWGPGAEFGALRTGPSETYWYGYLQHAQDASYPDELAAAQAHFGTWAPEVARVVAATRPERLVRHDVFHLAPPLPSYVHGRVVLIGDAAHALVPTMGQGANTALEDGVSVGLLVRGVDLGAELRAFDRDRRPRTQAIARRSLATQRMGADLRGGWARGVRDRLMRLVPARAALRAGTRILHWQPPAP